MAAFVIGVDVGTGSARAGVFTPRGEMLASATTPIQTWRPRPSFVEQSSEDIWSSVCISVKEALLKAHVAGSDIAGISFDATCSLVVLDKAGAPLTVDAEGDHQRNIIVWMDHRALAETDEINSGDYEVLKYVGGKLSPEMETPKLLWLKRNLPETWHSAGKFLDLADYLTYRSTGVDVRSLCTVVCKWTFDGHGNRWDRRFFREVGLDGLFDDSRVVDDVRPMGTPIGTMLRTAADDLGLSESCQVGIGIIDAHAGGLGVLGAIWQDSTDTDPAKLETALALIGGTSNCHMAVSRDPVFIDGIWGPYFGAMVPGMWLTEGGQSAAGSAIDHVIADHAHAVQLRALSAEQGLTVYELLNAEIARLTEEGALPYSALLTRNLHVLPYFLGNRSPNADPHAAGIIDGLNLDESITSHALQYYATIQAVAYGTRDIVRAMNEAGYRIDTLFVTGGGTKNPVWLQEHADATGLRLALPKEPEAVLLGTAILAARAAGIYPTVAAAMQSMSHSGDIVEPDPATSAYHTAKFEIFRDMYREQSKRRAIMSAY